MLSHLIIESREETKMKLKNKLLFGVIFTSLLVSCGGKPSLESSSSEPSSSDTSDEVLVESVNFTNLETSLKVGDTLTLTYEVLPSNASDKSVSFAVDSEIATVNDAGILNALAEGNVNVTITTFSGAKTATLSLTITASDIPSKLNVDEYAGALSETPYSSATLIGQQKYGLVDGGVVGVHEELIIEKYPLPSDETFVSKNIINYESITLTDVNEYFTEVSELNDFYKFQTALYLAKAINDKNEKAKITLPVDGVLNIDASLSETSTAFRISGLKETYIEGNNATFIIHVDNLNWKGFLTLSNSKEVHFANFKVKHAIPASLTGQIKSIGSLERSMVLTVGQEFYPLLEALKTNARKIRSWVEYDVRTKAPLEGGNFIVDSFDSYTITGSRDLGYEIEVNFKQVIKRSRLQSYVALQFAQYDATEMSVSNSENITIENMTFNHASGMALTAGNVKNFYVNRFNLIPFEGSEALMTATADAMHFNQMRGDVFVTNSVIKYSHDDALNFKHGYWYKLIDASGGSTKQIRVSKITSAIPEPVVGDKLAIYNEQTFESQNPAQGYYTVSSIEVKSTEWIITVNERMSNVGEWGPCRVTFFSNTPNFVFANNIIANKRNRGVLVQVPGAVIENNTFMNVGHGSIQAASAMDVYNEATIPHQLTIRNNKFINNTYITPEPLYGDISIFAISNNATVGPAGTISGINISNNFIARNGNAAISLRGVSETGIKDNLFFETSRSQPSGSHLNTIVHVYNGASILVKDNYSHYTLDQGLSGVVLEGKTSPNDISLVNNTNIEFQANSESGPSVNIQKATSAITLDGNLSEWAGAGAYAVPIDGVSDAEGKEFTEAELSAHFAINSLYLTHSDDGIYIGFDVKDDLLDIRTVNDFWLGDAVEIFMSTVTNMPNADLMVYKEDGGVLQAAFAPNWESSNGVAVASVRTNSTYVTKINLMQTAIVTTAEGYVGEVFIPFAMAPEFKTSIAAGEPIAMAIVVADAERVGAGMKRIQMGNIPHFVETYKTKTARMPLYFFVE